MRQLNLLLSNLELELPKRVIYRMGLYTRIDSDLFIDDLTPNELRMIANHLEYHQTKEINENREDIRSN